MHILQIIQRFLTIFNYKDFSIKLQSFSFRTSDIRPIYLGLVHKYYYEGPCRFNPTEQCTPMIYKDGVATLPHSPLNPDELKPYENVPNMAFIFHSVGNRKMKGLDQPDGKYGITPFAFAGFGATMRYDFTQDAGQEITIAHLNPDCDKLFLAKGKIVASNNYSAKNCTLTAVFQVKDVDDFYEKQLDFAQHMPMTYGDHVDVLKRFAKSVGLEVVEA